MTPKPVPHPWQGPPDGWLSRKAWNARREYLDKWRDRMEIAYTAEATDDAAALDLRRDMAFREGV